MGVFLAGTGMTSVIGEIVATMGTVTASLTSEPLCYFLYAGVAAIGIGLFKKLRHSV